MSPSLTIMMLTSVCALPLSDLYRECKNFYHRLAFLFEGYDEQTLPEQVLGTVRLRNAEFGKKLRFVESFDE